MLAQKYIKKSQELIVRILETQLPSIETAAELIALATAEGHTLYAWGGPHSNLPVQDIFFRAGGLTIVNPIFTPGLSLEEGPIRLTSVIERAEGYGSAFFAQIGARSGDVILLVSTSGRNSFPIEMAKSAKDAGLLVIGLTSLEYSKSVTSRSSTGKKMYDYCDVVLDNLTSPGDAIIDSDLLPQKVGPTSGWVGCLILQALMAEVAERLAKKGIVPPIYFAANLDGQSEYVAYIDKLVSDLGTKFGGTFSPALKRSSM
ncbi:MAG: sugar isomerase domain-containing protein [Anaerolineaceae bacterium]